MLPSACMSLDVTSSPWGDKDLVQGLCFAQSPFLPLGWCSRLMHSQDFLYHDLFSSAWSFLAHFPRSKQSPAFGQDFLDFKFLWLMAAGKTLRLGNQEGSSISCGTVGSIACWKQRAVLPGTEKGFNVLDLRKPLSKRLVFLSTDVGWNNHLGS